MDYFSTIKEIPSPEEIIMKKLVFLLLLVPVITLAAEHGGKAVDSMEHGGKEMKSMKEHGGKEMKSMKEHGGEEMKSMKEHGGKALEE